MPFASPSSATARPFVCDPGKLRVAVVARQRALRLSQQDIAAQTGLTEPRLAVFLGPAQEDPSDRTVLRLAHWLDMPLASFNRDAEPFGAEDAEPARAVSAA